MQTEEAGVRLYAYTEVNKAGDVKHTIKALGYQGKTVASTSIHTEMGESLTKRQARDLLRNMILKLKE